MEVSPLVQLERPSFQPKIARLYEELFVEEQDHTAGFWAEFFLLKPDRSSFLKRLETVSADDLLHFQDESQQLFLHAAQAIKAAKAPSDEIALDVSRLPICTSFASKLTYKTLTVYLAAVLSKRYTNPSSDVISVLTGLDQVDTVFLDFANSIEFLIRSGRSQAVRRKAVRAALSVTSGAYQTSLVSYFTHRDLFPALIKYMQDADAAEDVFEPFVLLGLLANYNKFEYRNPYRMRMEDFVNEDATRKFAQGLGIVLAKARDQYVAVLEDQPDTSWTLSNTLSSIGLGMLAPIKAINPVAPAEDDGKERFTALPDPTAGVLLGMYDFANSNNLFCFNMTSDSSDPGKHGEAFGSFLSLTSYINHHAYRSVRASAYGHLSLIILRIIVEDPGLCKRLCDPNIKIKVRLCHQQQPVLPVITSSRSGAEQLLDVCIDTINHNLRKRLDVDLYAASLNVMHRVTICLAQNRIRLPYHWPQVWQSLLALARFLQKYADVLNAYSDMTALLGPLTKVLAIAVVSGVSFLPDSAAHDDLFYKLVEVQPVLEKLRDAYRLTDGNSAVRILLSTATHFHGLLESKGLMSRALSTKEVSRVVRSGAESLEVPDAGRLGVESFERWREGDEKTVLKKMARIVVEDSRRLLTEG